MCFTVRQTMIAIPSGICFCPSLDLNIDFDSTHVVLKLYGDKECVCACVQGCISKSDIGHRPTEFAKCQFDFSVERTNVPLLSCQHGHCLFPS